jgi:Flp pilus assembly CpaF family ATPase
VILLSVTVFVGDDVIDCEIRAPLTENARRFCPFTVAGDDGSNPATVVACLSIVIDTDSSKREVLVEENNGFAGRKALTTANSTIYRVFDIT